MIRVLMCLNCCSATARAGKQPLRKLSSEPQKINNGNIVDNASNFKSLKVFGTDVSRDEPDTTTTRNSLGDIRLALEQEGPPGGGSRQDLASSSTLVVEPFDEKQPVMSPQMADKRAADLGPEANQEETRSQQNNAAYKSIISQEVGQNNRASSPSTTRIGDYARIEYSPVAHSQSSSPGSTRHMSSNQAASSSDAVATNRQEPDELAGGGKMTGASGTLPRASKLERRQGFESSSISIASQLSSEMEKNLTNMLESANSPVPMFGTIGLPLGPMAGEGGTTTGSSRTEPALTSGSQESLSSDRPKSQATSAGFGDSGAHSGGGGGGGAALTAAESAEESEQQQQQVSLTNKQNSETSVTSRMQDVSVDGGRVSSSMNSTISSTLTNPTPTPSELSGTSSTKRRRLSAKGLLKKLKPGKSKKRTSSPASISTSSGKPPNDDANKQQ